MSWLAGALQVASNASDPRIMEPIPAGRVSAGVGVNRHVPVDDVAGLVHYPLE